MMLKFIIAFERRPGTSREECHQYLRFSHGPKVKSCADFARHVRRYVQNYALAELPELGNTRLVADGAAELWFDSAETFVRAYSEPKYLEDVRPDEANFTNPSRYVAAFTRESTVWDEGGAADVKMIRFLTVKAGTSESDSRSAWSGGYAKRLAAEDTCRSLARRYVQNWSIPSSENPFPLAEPFVGVDEFWFEDVFDVSAFVKAERRLAAQHGKLALMDLGGSIAFLASEGVMPGYA
jgi:hypothetical protein